MIPKILEFEDNHVKMTPQAYAIPEIKALIDKYDMDAKPYLTYIHQMTAPDSPYINIPAEEKVDSVVYDIQATIGEFDWEDPLLDTAISKLKGLYISPMISLAEELGEELHRFRSLLKNTPLTMENFKDRSDLLKNIDKVSTSYNKVKEQADKEMRVATKGDHELGSY